ncbi:MAG: bifunctional phosphopantothenoylcysteine decarboxylase/phosphopantothenate--cysteine ligase CoaBC [Acidobacteriota bacterium]
MEPTSLSGRKILLVISGGIAAYKSLTLIRELKKLRCDVKCVLSGNAHHFVTPLSVAAISENRVYSDLFSLTDEHEMGHIRLSREADLVVVAPATADLIAKMANGLADDPASTVLLASTSRILVAPAMNTAMWENPATVANMDLLRSRGVLQVGPGEGELACGDVGPGRMVEPSEILEAIILALKTRGALDGMRALVTAGPTYEPIDPVRFLGNRSSGKQGFALAAELASEGAETILVSGPCALPDPSGVDTVRVETAEEMLAAVLQRLPADIAVCAAAVADWRIDSQESTKIKKDTGQQPALSLIENPDILATLSAISDSRPALVVGFAAETERLLENATDKRRRKGCDWIVANDVGPKSGVFGGDTNTVHLITDKGSEAWPTMTKVEVARSLVQRIADHFAPQ